MADTTLAQVFLDHLFWGALLSITITVMARLQQPLSHDSRPFLQEYDDYFGMTTVSFSVLALPLSQPVFGQPWWSTHSLIVVVVFAILACALLCYSRTPAVRPPPLLPQTQSSYK